MKLIALLFGIAGTVAAQTAPGFSLDGPCAASSGQESRNAYLQAMTAKDFDKAVAYAKAWVRESCADGNRWSDLAAALAAAGRKSETIDVLQEVWKRGVELTPESVGRWRAPLGVVLTSREYLATPAGQRIARIRAASDERRARFRKQLSAMPAAQRPPKVYVAKDSCPLECCRYGELELVAAKSVFVVAAPGSGRMVGLVAKGTRVVAIGGEVHFRPVPFVVLGGPLPIATIAFVLDQDIEGFGRVFSRGKISRRQTGTLARYCYKVSANADDGCWGEFLEGPDALPKQVWWLMVKSSNGLTGWTNKPEAFNGLGNCGD